MSGRGSADGGRPAAERGQVRHALVYCIQDYKKHEGISDRSRRIDACSIARWFRDWTSPRRADDGETPTEEPRTFLRRVGWTRHGLIDPVELPRQPG